MSCKNRHGCPNFTGVNLETVITQLAHLSVSLVVSETSDKKLCDLLIEKWCVFREHSGVGKATPQEHAASNTIQSRSTEPVDVLAKWSLPNHFSLGTVL